MPEQIFKDPACAISKIPNVIKIRLMFHFLKHIFTETFLYGKH